MEPDKHQPTRRRFLKLAAGLANPIRTDFSSLSQASDEKHGEYVQFWKEVMGLFTTDSTAYYQNPPADGSMTEFLSAPYKLEYKIAQEALEFLDGPEEVRLHQLNAYLSSQSFAARIQDIGDRISRLQQLMRKTGLWEKVEAVRKSMVTKDGLLVGFNDNDKAITELDEAIEPYVSDIPIFRASEFNGALMQDNFLTRSGWTPAIDILLDPNGASIFKDVALRCVQNALNRIFEERGIAVSLEGGKKLQASKIKPSVPITEQDQDYWMHRVHREQPEDSPDQTPYNSGRRDI